MLVMPVTSRGKPSLHNVLVRSAVLCVFCVYFLGLNEISDVDIDEDNLVLIFTKLLMKCYY